MDFTSLLSRFWWRTGASTPSIPVSLTESASVGWNLIESDQDKALQQQARSDNVSRMKELELLHMSRTAKKKSNIEFQQRFTSKLHVRSESSKQLLSISLDRGDAYSIMKRVVKEHSSAWFEKCRGFCALRGSIKEASWKQFEAEWKESQFFKGAEGMLRDNAMVRYDGRISAHVLADILYSLSFGIQGTLHETLQIHLTDGEVVELETTLEAAVCKVIEMHEQVASNQKNTKQREGVLPKTWEEEQSIQVIKIPDAKFLEKRLYIEQHERKSKDEMESVRNFLLASGIFACKVNH